MTKNIFDSEVCCLQRKALQKDLKNLEVRIFETLKKIAQLSDMSHDGHKESLKAAIISMQKDFEDCAEKLSSIQIALKDLEKVVTTYKDVQFKIENSFKTQKNRVKLLTKVVYILSGVMLLYVITGEDLSKVLSFVIKLLA